MAVLTRLRAWAPKAVVERHATRVRVVAAARRLGRKWWGRDRSPCRYLTSLQPLSSPSPISTILLTVSRLGPDKMLDSERGRGKDAFSNILSKIFALQGVLYGFRPF